MKNGYKESSKKPKASIQDRTAINNSTQRHVNSWGVPSFCNGKIQRSSSSTNHMSRSIQKIFQSLFPQEVGTAVALQRSSKVVVKFGFTRKETQEIWNRLGNIGNPELDSTPNKILKLPVKSGQICLISCSRHACWNFLMLSPKLINRLVNLPHTAL